MQYQKFADIRYKIERNYQDRIITLDRIKSHTQLIEDLSDSELRIAQKNPYFRYHKTRAVWPLTNFLELPEMVADPAYAKIADLYKKIQKRKRYVHEFTEAGKLMEQASLLLSDMATKMANRTMTQTEYDTILSGKYEQFIKYTLKDIKSARLLLNA